MLALGAPAAFGFDSEEWLLRRAVLEREAERMRGVYTNCAARAGLPFERVVVPLGLNDDGTAKMSLCARRAVFHEDLKCVVAEGVTVVIHGKEGGDGSAALDACVVERQSKDDVSVWGEGHAKVSWRGVTLEGDGMYISLPEEYVKVVSNVEIVAKDVEIGSPAAYISDAGGKKAKGGSE